MPSLLNITVLSYLIADGDQVHERASAGHQGGSEAHVCRHLPGLPRYLQHAAVETHALRRGLPPHMRTGTTVSTRHT